MYIHNLRHEARLNEVLELKYYLVDIAHQHESFDALRKQMVLKIQAENVLNLEERLKTEISKKIREKIQLIEERPPAVAVVLELLNQRIDVIQDFLQELYQLDVDRRTSYQKLTSLSRSGIGFDVMELIGLNRVLLLDLTLFPSKIKLMPFAKVVACEANEHKPGYYLQLQFVDLPKNQQTELEKYIETRLDELLQSKKNS